jgi:hypothetical protein
MTGHGQVAGPRHFIMAARSGSCRVRGLALALLLVAAAVAAAQEACVATPHGTLAGSIATRRTDGAVAAAEEGAFGPCCDCCVNDACAAGYTCCGGDAAVCYCCIQGRTCVPGSSGLASTTCARP